MLRQLFPKAFVRFVSLPLLGPIANEFAVWLLQQGYEHSSARQQLRTIVHIDAKLRRRGIRHMGDLTCEKLRVCLPANSQDNRILAGTVHTLKRFLDKQGLLPPPVFAEPNHTDALLAEYRAYLEDVRGIGHSTTRSHLTTIARFLEHLVYATNHLRLATLDPNTIETFVCTAGKKYSRGSLQHVIAHVRGFLRFLKMKGVIPPGLDTQIDTPRIYRFEQLPRSVSWEKVCAFLHSIDRTTPMGLRDYTMLFLIATYGLRTCEIVSLTLDDIHWRDRFLQVPQRKTGSTLLLPLTDDAGTTLLRYLRRRASSPYRELFLRARAPAGRLKPTAVTDVFQAWLTRSGLDIPMQGPHCLRHSYAVHLLRQGTSLKSIGDLLGHRNAESTCTYLRLSVEDLRNVALPVPQDDLEFHIQEVKS